MSDRELIAALRRLKVQTGSLACLGCGREHNCGIHGCAILREAIAFVEKKLAEEINEGRIKRKHIKDVLKDERGIVFGD